MSADLNWLFLPLSSQCASRLLRSFCSAQVAPRSSAALRRTVSVRFFLNRGFEITRLLEA